MIEEPFRFAVPPLTGKESGEIAKMQEEDRLKWVAQSDIRAIERELQSLADPFDDHGFDMAYATRKALTDLDREFPGIAAIPSSD